MNRCILFTLCLLCINLFLTLLLALLDTRKINKTIFISQLNPSPLSLSLNRQFDINKPGDVLVFFHIQKTGGSKFEADLVTDIKGQFCPGEFVRLPKKQKTVSRKHKCFKRNSTENWLFTRQTVGWACGVHPDFITLKLCAPTFLSATSADREWNLSFITMLRNPVTRFISEYLHVTRGAKWPVYKKSCSHSPRDSWLNLETLPHQCEFMDRDRSDLTVNEFLNCPQNPAINRMTQMLADNLNSECTHNRSGEGIEMEILVLNSAKHNLEKMAYFGILEYFTESKHLFEQTFSLQYDTDSHYIPSHSESYSITNQHRHYIETANHLDVQLYEWAVELFLSRLKSKEINNHLQ